MTVVILLVAAFVSFTLSASAGLGGSLVLVPTLVLILGAKSGIALASLLLAANNLAKLIAYRKTIPIRSAAAVIILIAIGAWLGASALVRVDEQWVQIAVIVSILLSFLAEKRNWVVFQKLGAPFAAFVSGATSGFSGTSGPLKGIALRNLRLSRAYLVGAASAASFLGDLTKATVFIEADLMPAETLWVFLIAVPLMPVATVLGRNMNRRMGEQAFAVLFWIVMAGYSTRLLVT